MSIFWFKWMESLGIKTHFISDVLPDWIIKACPDFVGRSLIVRKLEMVPIEAIVRGYLTGSGWNEYKTSGTLHGMTIRKGYQECGKLDEPTYTPSTKAEMGDHDENISQSAAEKILGQDTALKVKEYALKIYSEASKYAYERGIIIADTKFEFGRDSDGILRLGDEVLTPDSSRFWSAASYCEGQSNESYDKQYLRDWLTEHNLRAKADVTISPEIVNRTLSRYTEAYNALVKN